MRPQTIASLVVRLCISATSLALTVVAAVLVSRELSVVGIFLCIYGAVGIAVPLISAAICVRNDEPATGETWMLDGGAAFIPTILIAIIGAVFYETDPTYAHVGTIISVVIALTPFVLFIGLAMCMGCRACINWCTETYHIIVDREFHDGINDNTLV